MKACNLSVPSQWQDPPELEDITAIILEHRAPTEAELDWMARHLSLVLGVLKAAPQSAAKPQGISVESTDAKAKPPQQSQSHAA
jgi:hypothetical protein